MEQYQILTLVSSEFYTPFFFESVWTADNARSGAERKLALLSLHLYHWSIHFLTYPFSDPASSTTIITFFSPSPSLYAHTHTLIRTHIAAALSEGDGHGLLLCIWSPVLLLSWDCIFLPPLVNEPSAPNVSLILSFTYSKAGKIERGGRSFQVSF